MLGARALSARSVGGREGSRKRECWDQKQPGVKGRPRQGRLRGKQDRQEWAEEWLFKGFLGRNFFSSKFPNLVPNKIEYKYSN